MNSQTGCFSAPAAQVVDPGQVDSCPEDFFQDPLTSIPYKCMLSA